MKKRILIVENNKDIREVLTEILVYEGYQVKAYATEEKIFEHIQVFKPDTILLDIVQPTLKGTELCRTIKSAEGTKHIPVIVLSTYIKINTFKEVCADEVVPKPFDISQLLTIIEGELAA